MRKRALVAGLLVLAACAGAAPLSMRTSPRAFTPEEYGHVYDLWTRTYEGYDWGNLQNTLTATATFESWEYRWAYVIRYARDHSLDTPARTAMLRATLTDAGETHRFFVTLVGRLYRESDLTREQSAWRVLLVDDHDRTEAPSEIIHITHPTADDKTYFPTVNPFRQVFRITFPAQHADHTPTIPPGCRHVILRFTGAQGRADLQWDLAPATAVSSGG